MVVANGCLLYYPDCKKEGQTENSIKHLYQFKYDIFRVLSRKGQVVKKDGSLLLIMQMVPVIVRRRKALHEYVRATGKVGFR